MVALNGELEVLSSAVIRRRDLDLSARDPSSKRVEILTAGVGQAMYAE